MRVSVGASEYSAVHVVGNGRLARVLVCECKKRDAQLVGNRQVFLHELVGKRHRRIVVWVPERVV